ncbi:transposase [Hyunsoonleella ulvae]|uniref:transposase n=1 Tax=Hyunsoonleella ulvae TaxID=2799948 RepID=UPI001939ADB5|nr:transposase [Hyunsoonleella ulvae]
MQTSARNRINSHGVKSWLTSINPAQVSYFVAMSRKYKFYNRQGLYFVSFTTVNWIDVFTRLVYFDVLADSVGYCRAEKGMELYSYCFMPSHVHFIFRSSNQEPMELLRDFKKCTAKKGRDLGNID